MRTVPTLVVAVVAAVVLAIPATAQTTPERAGEESFRGYITDKRPADGGILVEEKPCRIDGRIVEYTRCRPSQWRGEKGYFRVDGRTRIFDRSGGTREPARYEDLAVGQKVHAGYRGAVRESYPTQGTARRVTILAEPEAP